MRSSLVRRPMLLLGAVVALLGASAMPAFAGTPTGQVGHYDMKDSESSEVVNCRYKQPASGAEKLDKFVAKAPLAWWPDTNSSNDTQHGTVGWQVRIQENPLPDGGTWTLAYKSGWQKRTAYEDQPFQDAADSADFSGRGILWNKSGTKAYRVIYVIRWYNKNGTVKGTVKHQVLFYNLTGVANGEFVGYCSNRLLK